MSALVLPPDASYLVIGYLQAAFDGLLPARQIVRELPPTSSDAPQWITVSRAGGPGPRRDIPLGTYRFDIRCYATSGHTAERLWANLDARLAPGPLAAQGFTQDGYRITDVAREANPLGPLAGPGRLVAVWAPYLVRLFESPVAA